MSGTCVPPLLQLAYDRATSCPQRARNQIEQDALLAVVGALAKKVRPVVLADRGFARATFFAWLKEHRLDYVVRIDKGTCLTEADGYRWKLGEEGLSTLASCVGHRAYVTVSTTDAPPTSCSTWLCAGGFPRAERTIPAANDPKNPGIWPRASVALRALPVGTGREAG